MPSNGACDIAIAIGSMVPSISAEMVGKWVFGDIICNVQVFATTYFSSLESCFIMLCAVDRGLAIAKPLSYSQMKHVYKRLFLASVAAFIILNIPIPFLMVHLAEKIHYAKPLAACAAKLYPRHSILPFMGYALQFFVPGFVIIICYVFIGYKAIQSKRANQIRRNTQQNYNSVSRKSVNKSPECSSAACAGGTVGADTGTDRSIRRASQLVLTKIGTNWQSESNSLSTFLKHLKLCKMLLVVAIVYFLSFLPIFVYQLMVWVGLIRINMYHYKIINILQYFNGVIDGIVFYSMSQTFKDRVNAMFCQLRQKNDNTAKERNNSACPPSSMQSNRNSSVRYSKNPTLNAPSERRYTHQYLHVQTSHSPKKT